MRHMEFMKMQQEMFDVIEKPKHYNIGIEPAEYMESLNIA